MSKPNTNKDASLERAIDLKRVFAGIDGGYAFLRPRLSDTEVVVLASALLDEMLRFSLLMAVSSKVASKTVVDEAFSGTAPLASFSARIKVCALFEIITRDTKHDLSIIKRIRNDFAHATSPQSLEDYEGCLSLRMGVGDNTHVRRKNRRRFVSSCAQIIHELQEANCRSLVERAYIKSHKDEVDMLVKSLLSWANRPAADRQEGT